MKIISLGWGVQSFTLAAMAALGELEPVEYAIHADTTHESALTYDFAQRWVDWLGERGVKVVTVREPRATQELGADSIQTHIPAFTVNSHGKDGQALRSCTQRWKIAPMRRYIQETRNGEPVEQWLGISLDEYQRMKDSDVKYITHRWPLIERKMTRADCVKWLESHGLEVPPK